MTQHLVPTVTAPVAPGPAPSFSVIIACFNAADSVGAAITSCLEQTVPPLEIVVVDDGSTDDLDRALEPYLSHITFLRQANGGESAAKNTGVAAASGEYVVILDADDIAYLDRLAALGALAAERPDLAILTHDANLTQDGVFERRFFSDHHPFPIREQRVEILRRCFIVNPAVQRLAWLRAGGFDPAIRIGADWECWIRMILGGASVGCVDAPLTEYRQSGTQLTADRLVGFTARIALLAKTARRTDLTRKERRVVHESIAELRVRVVQEAERLRAPQARGAWWRVVGGRHHSLRIRAHGLVHAMVPHSMLNRNAPQ